MLTFEELGEYRGFAARFSGMNGAEIVLVAPSMKVLRAACRKFFPSFGLDEAKCAKVRIEKDE